MITFESVCLRSLQPRYVWHIKKKKEIKKVKWCHCVACLKRTRMFFMRVVFPEPTSPTTNNSALSALQTNKETKLKSHMKRTHKDGECCCCGLTPLLLFSFLFLIFYFRFLNSENRFFLIYERNKLKNRKKTQKSTKRKWRHLCQRSGTSLTTTPSGRSPPVTGPGKKKERNKK